jgi:hypothetical protein
VAGRVDRAASTFFVFEFVAPAEAATDGFDSPFVIKVLRVSPALPSIAEGGF